MNPDALRQILTQVAQGEQTVDAGVEQLTGTVQLGYATVDLARSERRGIPEVIFGTGKTIEQIIGIMRALRTRNQRALVTRLDATTAAAVSAAVPDCAYNTSARCLWSPAALPTPSEGLIIVVSAGTSDLPVASEAVQVAQLFGNQVQTVTDVGVAGLHRLLAQLDTLRKARVLIVCAGMEGALPGVVAGLVNSPVIGVPTSVGYGVSAGGYAALMGMLSACSAGLTVVNIDNGFGAAYAATLINQGQR